MCLGVNNRQYCTAVTLNDSGQDLFSLSLGYYPFKGNLGDLMYAALTGTGDSPCFVYMIIIQGLSFVKVSFVA